MKLCKGLLTALAPPQSDAWFQVDASIRKWTNYRNTAIIETTATGNYFYCFYISKPALGSTGQNSKCKHKIIYHKIYSMLKFKVVIIDLYLISIWHWSMMSQFLCSSPPDCLVLVLFRVAILGKLITSLGPWSSRGKRGRMWTFIISGTFSETLPRQPQGFSVESINDTAIRSENC